MVMDRGSGLSIDDCPTAGKVDDRTSSHQLSAFSNQLLKGKASEAKRKIQQPCGASPHLRHEDNVRRSG
jgi:hypothetical protein